MSSSSKFVASDSENVVVPPSPSDGSSAAPSQGSGSGNSSSINGAAIQGSLAIGSLPGNGAAPPAQTDSVGETPESSVRKSTRIPWAPQRFTDGQRRTTTELFHTLNSPSIPSSSQAGEPSRKRAKKAAPAPVAPQLAAPQPSTSGQNSRKRKAAPIQNLPHVAAPPPSSSIGIQTDAIPTPPTKQDAATMPDSSEYEDAGVQATGHDSLGLNGNTPPIYGDYPEFDDESVHESPALTENEPGCSDSSPPTSSVSDRETQTDSVCSMETSDASTNTSSPPSVLSCGSQTDSPSMGFTVVSSESWAPSVTDAGTQADPEAAPQDPEEQAESAEEPEEEDPEEPEEVPSTSSSNPAGDALAALFQNIADSSPTSSDGSISGRLRSKNVVPTPRIQPDPFKVSAKERKRIWRHQHRQQRKQACAPRQLYSLNSNPEARMLDDAFTIQLLTKEEVEAILAPKSREQFRKRLDGLDQGTKGFMEEWARGEKLLANPAAPDVFTWKNGHEFMANVEKHRHGVHLIENKDGMGMKVPEDLDFDTVRDYIKTGKEVGVINSATQGTEFMTMSKLLEEFRKAVRTSTYNLLSLEFAQTEDRLKEAFEEPSFVKSYSMVMKLEKALEDLKKNLERKLEDSTIQEEKEKIKKDMEKIDHQLKTMPKFQKFLLLSMTGSFTDIHIDFSGTSVFYHVIKGRKIFYVAPPTAENLEIYNQFERHERGGEEWIGEVLFPQWVRIEIKEGQTAMIPSGYLHFVYTPEDSIVIGGNYLVEKFVERQFEMSKLEDFCVHKGYINEGNLFKGFWDAMWSFAEHCLIPELTDSRKPSIVERAQIFLKELILKLEDDLQKEEQKKKEEEEKKKKEAAMSVADKKKKKKEDVQKIEDVKKDWYSCAEKKMILEELEGLCQ